MDVFCLAAPGCNTSYGRSILTQRIRSNQSSGGAYRALKVLCLASKGQGFGSQPPKKEKNKIEKNLNDMRTTSETSEFTSGEPNAGAQMGRQLTRGNNWSSNDAVLDQKFMEKLEAVRRSALEQKKAEKEKIYQPIDYDAPIKSEKNTVTLGTKVGVAVAVLVFGLVFAFGDFLPYGSVVPSKDPNIGGKELTKEEKTNLQKTLEEYKTSLSKSPEDTTALEGAVTTLEDLGDYEQASSLLEKLIKEKPNNADAYRLLGDLKFELKDYDGSASAYKKSLSISDNIDFEVLRGLTNSLLSAEKPYEAVQVLLKYREQSNRGDLKDNDSFTDINNLEKKTQKIDLIQVDLLLGKAYFDWGHVSDAVSVYDQLISKYPNDFRGYLAKGIILKQNGSFGDAERMFIQARFFAPDKAKAIVDRYSGK